MDALRTDMDEISYLFILSALLVFVLAMIIFAVETARRSSTLSRARAVLVVGAATPSDPAEYPTSAGSSPWRGSANALVRLASIGLAVGVVLRGLAAGRFPLGNMYEFAISGGLAVSVVFLTVLPNPILRNAGAWVTGLIALMLGLGVTILHVPSGELVPALNSIWLVIHVTAATIAGGVFTIGAVVSGLILYSRARTRRTRPDDVRRTHASTIEKLERLNHGLHVFAFPIWTFAVMAGAIWAENAWGRYWGWDPKETWAFITWVLYAAYLHADVTKGAWARRAPWFAVAGFAAFVFNFFGVNLWINGLHSYAGV